MRKNDFSFRLNEERYCLISEHYPIKKRCGSRKSFSGESKNFILRRIFRRKNISVTRPNNVL